MKITKNILNEINALNEKASIDWNNYLTSEEIQQFLSKDDKIESAENIIYSPEFKKRYKDLHNDLQKKYNNSWTRRELVKDLEQFYTNGHLNEAVTNLWKNQMDLKTPEDLEKYLIKLYNQIKNYNSNEIKSNRYYDLLDKIEYIEAKAGITTNIGRILH